VLLPEGVDMVALALDSAVAAVPARPVVGPLPAGGCRRRPVGGGPRRQRAGVGGGPARPRRPRRRRWRRPRPRGRFGAGCSPGRGLGAVVAPLRHALEASGLIRLHDEVELPLVRVLARMEVAGIGVDAGELRRITDGFVAECGRLEAEIHQQAGETFNVNSTPQLRAVLYDRLGLTPGRKTKTGFSTDAQTLERIRDQHPVVETLLRYREVEKLRSTYGESLLAEVASDGRIHAPSSRRWPGRGVCRRTVPTCTTSRSAPRRAGSCAGPSCRRPATGCSWPTTTRSSCGSSPTWRRTRDSSPPSPRNRTSTGRRRPGSSGSRPKR